MDQITEQTPTVQRGTAARWFLLPLAMVVVALGVWVTGGLVTDDEQVARMLTGAWFVGAGVVAVLIAWRYRAVAAPVLVGYLLAAGGIGGFLLYTSSVDQVVDEDVVVAGPAAGEAGDEGAEEGGAQNTLLAEGDFRSQAHPTEGMASVIETEDGGVLTLTGFVTDPGPDLRVYLVPAGADGVNGGTDLGALKGNNGDQQYDLSASTLRGDLDGVQVVIWCRAFSVAFGTADLA